MRDRPRFFEKTLFSPKIGKMNRKWAKNWSFFNLMDLVINYFLNMVYNESLCYLLYSCTNPIFGKNLVPGIWAKMLLANQIAGFLNQLYL